MLSGEQGIAASGADKDLRPLSVTSITGKSRPNSAATVVANSALATSQEDNSTTTTPNINNESTKEEEEEEEPYQRRGAIPVSNEKLKIESDPPAKETKLEDIVDDLPPHVLSRPGSPKNWKFDEKEQETLTTEPPRPTSASLCSPPVPRKVPISVDHHLRK